MSGRHTGPFARYDDAGAVSQVMPPTGKTFSTPQTHWFRHADGKIIEHWAHRDDLATAQQAGWIPPTPGTWFAWPSPSTGPGTSSPSLLHRAGIRSSFLPASLVVSGGGGGDMSDRPSPTESCCQQDVGGYFAPLASVKSMLLTTFEPGGIPVTTRVRGVVDGDRAYFQAWSQSGTVKNLTHTDEVQVAPYTALGFLSFGPPLDAVARRLTGEEASRAAGKLVRKHPVRPRFLIPLLHRMRRGQMVQYELLTYEAAAAVTCDRRASGVPDRSAVDRWSERPGIHQITVVRSSAPFPWP